MSTTMSRRMRSFKRWMNDHSIHYTTALDFIIQQHDQQVYVKTSSDLHSGDIIATIPKQSCLTVKSSGGCDLIEEFGLEGYMALSVAIMYEKSLKEASNWFGYFQIMPDRNDDVPLLWSVDEIDQLLLGTELHKTVKEDKALVYEDWKACILPFVESASVQLNPDDFSVEKYFAAKSLISSRSFQIDDYYGFGMVPLADLFNHKTDAEDVHFTSVSSHSDSESDSDVNVENEIDADKLEDHNESNVDSPKSEFSVDDDDASSSTSEILEMIMVRDVKAGAEVFNTYGSMGNAALLHRYGFTEPDNPYDIVNIDLELVQQWSSSVYTSRHTRSRLSLWKRLYHSEFPNQDIDYFEISYDGEPEVELLKLIFIISLPEKAYNEFDKSKAVSVSKKERIMLGEITETNKKLLLTECVGGALLLLADIRDRCYGSRSMEDDVEALKKCPVTDKKMYHSLVLSISERRILEKLRIWASSRRRLLNVCNGSTIRKKVPKR
ncbi:ribosomal lysine N-methyltransferase 3 [Rutidosis leptorrhynchoides]|uniref:ribosomal lysine N-methyltransferase 3 n=1 Tax=Rutidosis leptorrhynchoides TaxID=125765 RepID=UPI003A992470